MIAMTVLQRTRLTFPTVATIALEIGNTIAARSIILTRVWITFVSI